MLNALPKWGFILFAIIVFNLIPLPFPVQSTLAEPKTVEERMAFIDGNYPLSVKIARYQYLLTSLEKKTGDSKERIGDMTFKAQDILKKQYGKEITLLDLLEGVNKSIPHSKNKVPFANVIAAYIMFAGE